jgi:hypothetical protein
MEQSDAELIASIKPDVMRVLNGKRFFERLDDVLCPSDGTSPGICSHSYAISEAILMELDFDEDDRHDIFEVLKSEGGFCDCEILYNASESNRLKNAYWLKRSGT